MVGVHIGHQPLDALVDEKPTHRDGRVRRKATALKRRADHPGDLGDLTSAVVAECCLHVADRLRGVDEPNDPVQPRFAPVW